MPTRHLDEFADVVRDPELALEDVSLESFDRLAFAARALALVKPAKTRVALGESRSRVVVEAGRAWGGDADARWAVLRVPPHASKRAIAVAVIALAQEARPWAIDVLLDELRGAA